MFSAVQKRLQTVALSEERRTFMRRTYGHLLGAVLVFVVLEVLLFRTGIAARIAAPLQNYWWAVLGAFMILGWLASRVAHTAKTQVAQYVALIGFVVLEAIIFVPLLYFLTVVSDTGLLATVGYVTAAAFTGLTAVVLLSRKDFSFLRSFLMYGGIVAIILIAISFIFPLTLGVWFSVAMILFSGAAVLYDTSNILHHYPSDRYAGAALGLFASVAMMFWYIARLFMSFGE